MNRQSFCGEAEKDVNAFCLEIVQVEVGMCVTGGTATAMGRDHRYVSLYIGFSLPPCE